MKRTGMTILFSVFMAVGIAASSLAEAADQSGSGKEMTNPFSGKPEMIKQGEKIFDTFCSDCHGGDAMGGSGPDLTDDKWIYGGADAQVFETISGGRKGGMPSWGGELKQDGIWKVISYIRSLSKKK